MSADASPDVSPGAGQAGRRTAALVRRAGELEAALDRGGSRIPADVADQARAVLVGVRERLALGVDHTVVALVGGTGSGKSSVFNALTGLDFADVGVKRPTTSRVTACVWSHGAGPLLDWLGVTAERRIERESALDGDSQADLRGLVLLDLPDHDSVEPEHRAVVDGLLPLVDLLVWVVDPQKYADDALHTGYLRHLVGHEAAVVVVLNQVDTVPDGAREALLDDVARLLTEDGLVGVRVVAVSARTGEGLVGLREVLADAVAGHGVAQLRASAELDDAARALAATVGPREPALPTRLAVDTLLEAAGVPEMVQAVRAAVRSGSSTAVRGATGPGVAPALGPVQADRAALVRAAWLEELGAGLPRPWADHLASEVADDDALVRGLDERLGAIPVDARRSGGARGLFALALVAGLVALLLAGLTAWPLLVDTAPELPVAGAGGWLAAGLAGLLGLVLAGAGRLLRGRAAASRAAELAAAGRGAVERAVADHLGAPSSAVLDDHRAVREAAAAQGPAVVHKHAGP